MFSSSSHPENIFFAIVSTLLGIVISFKFVQPSKVLLVDYQYYTL